MEDRIIETESPAVSKAQGCRPEAGAVELDRQRPELRKLCDFISCAEINTPDEIDAFYEAARDLSTRVAIIIEAGATPAPKVGTMPRDAAGGEVNPTTSSAALAEGKP